MARKQRRSKQPQQLKKGQEPSKRDWYRLSAELREWFKVCTPIVLGLMVTSSQPLKNWVA